MKIKVTDRSFDEVMALEPYKHRLQVKQSRFFRWLLKTASAGEVKAVDFKCTYKNMDRISEGEPCLYLMNHSSFTDLQIAATILAKHQYHIVCTGDGFVGKDGLMRKIGCIPTDKFVADLNLVRDMKHCVEKLNSSILMFPEASYSFDGTETPLPESLGKCVRLLKVPVVMIKTNGAYLRDPLYNNLQKRDVKVTAEVWPLITKEETRALTLDEINQRLKEAFRYDHFRKQVEDGVKITESFRADGLHRALYKCPKCKAEGKMHGLGAHITCTACGDIHELTEEGKLKGVNGETSFEYVSDWYNWERKCVREEIEGDAYKLEEPVDILMLVDRKSMYRVGEGVLNHDRNGMHLTGCDGKLDFFVSGKSSYCLYADYFWYELGDMISIGDNKRQYYCFPKDQEGAIVAKARLAVEEIYKL